MSGNDTNVCIFTGRMGKDPELKYRAGAGGEAIAVFPMAVGRRWKDRASGESRDATTWLECVATGSLAESIGKNGKKGRFALIRAEYRVRRYTDGKGLEQFRSEHVVHDIQFLDRRDEDRPSLPPHHTD